MHEVLNTRFWALEKGFFNKMHPLVTHRIITGRDLSNLGYKPEAYYDDGDYTPPPQQISSEIVMEWDRSINMYVYRIEDGRRMARIPMIGTLSKYAGMCQMYGSIDYTNMILRANENSGVNGILLFADGPGGSVSGTNRLGEAVANSEKPVLAFVDEWAASAHYWVSSQADYIMANEQEYTEVGSIGVLCAMMNYSEWLQKEGIQYEIMRAEQSEDKARLNQVEPWPEKSIEELQNELNMMANDFIQTVGRGRDLEVTQGENGLLQIVVDGENITTGKMYSMDEAMQLGMIDHTGRLEDAIVLCADVADTRSRTSIVV